MLTLSFYKIAGEWFMDDPAYLEAGGNPSYLEVVGGMNDLLELVAHGNSAVQLMADITPFEEADEMVLMEPSGGDSGGYYRIHSLRGQIIEQDIWLNKLLYFYFNELPPRIYLKFN